MKKKLLLVLSSILLSIVLLVGCTDGEPGFEEEQPTENFDPTEADVDFNEDDEFEETEEDEETTN